MNRKFETNAIRTQLKRSSFREHSVPVYQTSSFIFESAEQARDVFAETEEGYIYSRFNNPNCDEFIEKLCILEGTETGIATASGMAAVFLTIAGTLQAGDHLIMSRHLFGTTHLLVEQILPKWGITHSYVDLRRKDTLEEALLPMSKMVFAETPSNPALDIVDLEWLGKFTNTHNLYLAIDNCFATPYLQNPAKYGADFVIHSATKFIDGQGRVVGGAVLGPKDFIKEMVMLSRITGPVMSPQTGWILSKSLETLAVRMDRHCANAADLAGYLLNHPKVEQVRYPFLAGHPQHEIARRQMKQGGALVSFDVNGGSREAMKFINKLRLLSISSNLGDTRTIITHPATTTHSKLLPEDKADAGITDGMVRVSVGLENIADIIADIEQALK